LIAPCGAGAHGLAATSLRDPALKAEVDRVATVICGKGADPAKREQALIIAESKLSSRGYVLHGST
jgi:hypothetical protein